MPKVTVTPMVTATAKQEVTPRTSVTQSRRTRVKGEVNEVLTRRQ